MIRIRLMNIQWFSQKIIITKITAWYTLFCMFTRIADLLESDSWVFYRNNKVSIPHLRTPGIDCDTDRVFETVYGVFISWDMVYCGLWYSLIQSWPSLTPNHPVPSLRRTDKSNPTATKTKKITKQQVTNLSFLFFRRRSLSLTYIVLRFNLPINPNKYFTKLSKKRILSVLFIH